VNCPYAFIDKDLVKPWQFTCKLCGQKYCTKCLKPHNPDVIRCENLESAANQDVMSKLDQAVIEATTRPCPICKTRIEKNEGCQAVRCSACGHQFCWDCGAPHDDLARKIKIDPKTGKTIYDMIHKCDPAGKKRIDKMVADAEKKLADLKKQLQKIPVKYGDIIYIKNLKKGSYATYYKGQELTYLVAKKAKTDDAKFSVLASLSNSNKKDQVLFGDKVFFYQQWAFVIGEAEKSSFLLYGMKRTLLGLVPLKGLAFKILPTQENFKDVQLDKTPVFVGDPIQLQVAVDEAKTTDKFFRFNVDASTFKGGPEIFISDDSKLMTKLAIKWTKELTFIAP
jgi:hypothetical protein